MKQFSIERSLHILGPVLGKKRGVEVRIGGGQACTDGKTIWLPALPPDDAEAAALGFGLLFHETNHVRYTDFAVGPHSDFVGQIRLMPDRDRKDVFRTYRELFGRFRLSNRQASIFRVPISGPETILGNGLRHDRGSKYADEE